MDGGGGVGIDSLIGHSVQDMMSFCSLISISHASHLFSRQVTKIPKNTTMEMKKRVTEQENQARVNLGQRFKSDLTSTPIYRSSELKIAKVPSCQVKGSCKSKTVTSYCETVSYGNIRLKLQTLRLNILG